MLPRTCASIAVTVLVLCILLGGPAPGSAPAWGQLATPRKLPALSQDPIAAFIDACHSSSSYNSVVLVPICLFWKPYVRFKVRNGEPGSTPEVTGHGNALVGSACPQQCQGQDCPYAGTTYLGRLWGNREMTTAALISQGLKGSHELLDLPSACLC